jgi:antitoxin YefM
VSTLPLSEVKARLSELAEEVGRTHERLHITRNGREYVVLIAAEDLESLEATLELLADPQAQERILQAQKDIAEGHVLDEQQVRDLIKRAPEARE